MMAAVSGKRGYGLALTVAAIFAAVTFVAPLAANSIDDALYVDMARSMAKYGSFFIDAGDKPGGAPALTKLNAFGVGGGAAPQYPGSYGVVMAPFYAAFGARGLMLANALAGAFVLFATRRLAWRLFKDEALAGAAVMLLAFATFFSSYLFVIWPHMLETAFVAAAALFLSAGAANEKNGLENWRAASAGALLGAAFLVRVDIVVFIGAFFVWVRLFVAPSRRMAAMSFVAAAAPAFVVSAFINRLKFGVLTPMTYGPKMGPDSAERYAPLLGAGLCAAVILLAIDISAPAAQRAWAAAKRPWPMAALAVLFVALLGLSHPGRIAVKGLYVLLVDLQALDPAFRQPGVIKSANGFWSFWGVHKQALLQSAPFAMLLVIGLRDFFAGRNIKPLALIFAAIGGPVLFFALNEWHGGFGRTMRYFAACLPFVAIGAAYALRRTGFVLTKQAVAWGVVGAAGAVATGAAEITSDSALSLGLYYYPQIVLAAVLGVFAAVIREESAPRFRHAFFSVVGGAIGLSVGINGMNLLHEESRRAALERLDVAFAQVAPPGALVLTSLEDRWSRAAQNGAFVMRPDPKDAARVEQAAIAFLRGGRCVILDDTSAELAPVIAAAVTDVTRRHASPRIVALQGVPRSFDALILVEAVDGACVGRPTAL